MYFKNRNLDPFTETYGLSFYLQYLTHWPEYFQIAESPNGDIMGYSMSSLTEWLFFLSIFLFHSNGKDWRNGNELAWTRNCIDSGTTISSIESSRKVDEWFGNHFREVRSLFFVDSINWLITFYYQFIRKQAYFVDLFVRISNTVAIQMYNKLGYSLYRQVIDYYTGDPDEDAYGKNCFFLCFNFN